ncbi:uncharacterized protein LOC105661927 [Megachile rotundata]|uniref:uncharacterized protein LOC105661927 n=1 Tax=Megachile rotundata TaxID=143995 RepID=UPI0006149E05|nr:PREDICTED: uncharacterized protein LOC105661927 [Megachile rotundata]
MLRRVDCQKYWKWKRQQEKKSSAKRKARKRKRKESVTDCIEVEESEAADTALKVRRPKIKKKKKDTWLSRPYIKCVPLEELMLRCIQPPIEIREQFLRPRHIDCLNLDALDIDILSPEVLKATTSLVSETQEADQIKDRKKCKTAMSILRKKSSRKVIDAKDIEDAESEEEDCKSICSTDSQICLQGIKITAKDKEEMKKFRKQKNSNKEKE